MAEHFGHSLVEGCKGVRQSKEHNSRLEEAQRCFKSCLPLIFFPYVYVLITPSYVEFCEEFFPLQVFEDGVDEGEWISVTTVQELRTR